MLRRTRKITGIYLGRDSIEAITIGKTGGAWSVLDEEPTPEESTAPIPEQVRAFLAQLKVERSRRITFAVPDTKVFFREISFPQLSPDEAVAAVRMAVDLHAHLKKEEIYFDVYSITDDSETAPSAEQDKNESKVILAYIERSFLSPILKAVTETGHQRSLGIISPLSCGIDGILRLAGPGAFPCTVLSRQDDDIRISLHSSTGWEGSHSVSLFSSSGLGHRLEEMSRLYPEPFGSLVKNPSFKIGEFQIADLEKNPKDPCSAIKALGPLCGSAHAGPALCAVGIAMKSYPEIAFQDAPRKKPFRLKINAFQILAFAVTAAMLAATAFGTVRMMRVSSRVNQVDKRLKELENRMKPLLETRAKIDEVEKKKQELTEFTKELPGILDVLREIATLTPTDTWIRNFSLSSRKFRLSAEGKSATACVAALRKSRLFSQVKLVSSVTKTKDGNERFSIEIVPRTSGRGGKK